MTMIWLFYQGGARVCEGELVTTTGLPRFAVHDRATHHISITKLKTGHLSWTVDSGGCPFYSRLGYMKNHKSKKIEQPTAAIVVKIFPEEFVFIIAFIAIFTLALALRLYELDAKSLWFDELLQIRIFQNDFSEIIHALLNDQHPPLSYFIQKVFVGLFRQTDSIGRLPSAIAGAFAVVPLFLLGRKVFSPFAAVLASAVIAVNIGALTQAQYIRPYSFLLLFATWHFAVCWCLIEGVRIRYGKTQLVISAVLALYSDTFGLAAVGCTIALFAVYPIASRIFPTGYKYKYKEIAKSYLPILVIYLPWAVALCYQVTATVDKQLSWTLEANLSFIKYILSYYLFGIWKANENLWPMWLCPVAAVLPFLGAFLPGRRQALRAVLGLMLLTVPLTAMLLSLVYPVFSPRHFIFLLPLAALLTGCLIEIALDEATARLPQLTDKIPHIKIVTLLLTMLVAWPFLVNYFNEGKHQEPYKGDWKAVASYLRENAKAGDEVYLLRSDAQASLLDFYLPADQRRFQLTSVANTRDLAVAVNSRQRSMALIAMNQQPDFFRRLNKIYLSARHFQTWSLYFFDDSYDLEKAQLKLLVDENIVTDISGDDPVAIEPSAANSFEFGLFGSQIVYKGRYAPFGLPGATVYYYLFNRSFKKCLLTLTAVSACKDNSALVQLAGQGGIVKFPYRKWGEVSVSVPCRQGKSDLRISFAPCTGEQFYAIDKIILTRVR
jgi:mannosyltransferase